jgi:hypothetical protein
MSKIRNIVEPKAQIDTIIKIFLPYIIHNRYGAAAVISIDLNLISL